MGQSSLAKRILFRIRKTWALLQAQASLLSSSRLKPSVSWAQTGPNTYLQPYGFQEVLYGAISAPVGDPSLFIIFGTVTLSHSNPNLDLVPLIRNAWLKLRRDYPGLAAEGTPEGKLYTSPRNRAELQAWLDETFIVTDTPAAEHYRGGMVRTKRLTMHFCPATREVYIQGEHFILDGRAGMQFWDLLFRALNSPMSEKALWATDGSEISRLPPRSDDLLDLTERTPGRGQEHAMEILGEISTMSSPIEIPMARPLPSFSKENGAVQMTLGKKTTAAVVAACKAKGLSVTASWHVAAALATRELQEKMTPGIPGSKPVGSQFGVFGNFDLRRYFPNPMDLDAFAMNNHHGLLPHVLNMEGKSFAEMAKDVGKWYKQDMPAADPEVWSSLGPMVQMLVPELTAAVSQDTTPSLSSWGVVDWFIKPSYGKWHIEDLWFGLSITGPWLEHFVWTWKGQMSMHSCFNPAFYSQELVEEFNSLVVDKFLEGLGVEKVADEVFAKRAF